MSESPPMSPDVLVVEDDEHIAELLNFLLEREGFRPIVARDGHAAVRLIAELTPPRLVLLDAMLPFVDGFQLIGRIRGTEGWQAVPVLMLTSKSREQDIVRALSAGADDYVIKPFQPMELVARIRRCLKVSA